MPMKGRHHNTPGRRERTVGVGVRREALGPERQGPRADPEILDVGEVVGIFKRFEVLLEPACDEPARIWTRDLV